MTFSIERKSLILSSLALGIIVAAGVWILMRPGEAPGGGGPAVDIQYDGPHAFPVTPDSNRADPLEANEPSFASFRMTVKPSIPIEPGGGIRIEQGYLFQGKTLTGTDVRYAFPDPVLEDGSAPNFLSIEAKGAVMEASLQPAGLGRFTPQVRFPEGIPSNGEVVFHFGDPSMGSPGLAVPTHPLRIRFLTFLDIEGGGRYRPASGDHPEVEAFAAGADRFQVHGPSLTREAKILLKIVPVRGISGPSDSALPARDFQGRVEIRDNGHPLGDVVFKRGDRFKELEVSLPSRGLFRLAARSLDGRVRGESNPILFPDEEGEAQSGFEAFCRRIAGLLGDRLIYWGSLQNHTALGGHAAGLPDEAYRCAREEGALDFCALTDHSSNASFPWEALRRLPERFDDPGRFVAFMGYEWTSNVFGHRHIILRDAKDGIACSEAPTEDPFEVYAPDLDALSSLVGRDPDALLIVHHARRILDPAAASYVFGDPDALPRQMLFEVFSWQGGSEGAEDDLPINGREDRTHPSGSGFRDALRAGYRMGVTADSDSHLGLPGIAVSLRRKNGLRYGLSGLTAVLSPRLDREGIFQALERRRCYGTTGARILLFFLVGEGLMGDEVATSGEDILIQAAAFGTAPIRRIQVIIDGERILHESLPDSLEAEVDIRAPLPGGEGFHSFYLRLDQADGHRAWSSPVWVKKAQ